MVVTILNSGDKQALADTIKDELQGEFQIRDPKHPVYKERAAEQRIVEVVRRAIDRFFD